MIKLSRKVIFFGCWKSLSAASKCRKTHPYDYRISKFSGGACPRTPLEGKALRALPILCPGVKLSCPPVQNLNEPPAKLQANFSSRWAKRSVVFLGWRRHFWFWKHRRTQKNSKISIGCPNHRNKKISGTCNLAWVTVSIVRPYEHTYPNGTFYFRDIWFISGCRI